MRHVVFSVTAWAVVCLIMSTASAQAPGSRSDRSGFDFGGATEFDSPPLAKSDQEKRALAVLDADKKGYIDYLEKLLPLVRPGGLILGHDMKRPRPDPRYIEAITRNPDLDTSFVMMESFGISLTLKKR